MVADFESFVENYEYEESDSDDEDEERDDKEEEELDAFTALLIENVIA